MVLESGLLAEQEEPLRTDGPAAAAGHSFDAPGLADGAAGPARCRKGAALGRAFPFELTGPCHSRTTPPSIRRSRSSWR